MVEPEMEYNEKKKRIAMVAPIGQSPPVITEMAEYIIRGNDYLDSIWLISTSDEQVKKGVAAVKAAIASRYKTEVFDVPLKLPDISSSMDNIRFMVYAAAVIGKIKRERDVDEIVLNVAGGRKDMCITLSLLGEIVGISRILHIINPDVKTYNTKLEEVRSDIDKLAEMNDDDALRYYKNNRERFDEVMFPDLTELHFINIPPIPYPKDYINKLGKLLNSSNAGMTAGEIGMSQNELDLLEKSGLIVKINAGGGLIKYAPTELGEQLGLIWRQ